MIENFVIDMIKLEIMPLKTIKRSQYKVSSMHISLASLLVLWVL